MRYYTYHVIVANKDVPEDQLTKEEKELGYIPSKLDREINDIYNLENEEVVNMTITPITKAGDLFPTHYHIIYVTRDKK